MSDEGNPYLEEDGRPRLKKSVVAYLDILGYQDMVLEAEKNGTSQEFLFMIHTALTESFEILGERTSWDTLKNAYKMRTFTDNVVIGYPIHDHFDIGEIDYNLQHIFSLLSLVQLQMVSEGFFFRGAISVGDLYIDDKVIYGSGLIDAYKGETLFARDPRIILTALAKKTVKKHIAPNAPLSRDLLCDSDGQFFLKVSNKMNGVKSSNRLRRTLNE